MKRTGSVASASAATAPDPPSRLASMDGDDVLMVIEGDSVPIDPKSWGGPSVAGMIRPLGSSGGSFGMAGVGFPSMSMGGIGGSMGMMGTSSNLNLGGSNLGSMSMTGIGMTEDDGDVVNDDGLRITLSTSADSAAAKSRREGGDQPLFAEDRLGGSSSVGGDGAARSLSAEFGSSFSAVPSQNEEEENKKTATRKGNSSKESPQKHKKSPQKHKKSPQRRQQEQRDDQETKSASRSSQHAVNANGTCNKQQLLPSSSSLTSSPSGAKKQQQSQQCGHGQGQLIRRTNSGSSLASHASHKSNASKCSAAARHQQHQGQQQQGQPQQGQQQQQQGRHHPGAPGPAPPAPGFRGYYHPGAGGHGHGGPPPPYGHPPPHGAYAYPPQGPYGAPGGPPRGPYYNAPPPGQHGHQHPHGPPPPHYGMYPGPPPYGYGPPPPHFRGPPAPAPGQQRGQGPPHAQYGKSTQQQQGPPGVSSSGSMCSATSDRTSGTARSTKSKKRSMDGSSKALPLSASPSKENRAAGRHARSDSTASTLTTGTAGTTGTAAMAMAGPPPPPQVASSSGAVVALSSSSDEHRSPSGRPPRSETVAAATVGAGVPPPFVPHGLPPHPLQQQGGGPAPSHAHGGHRRTHSSSSTASSLSVGGFSMSSCVGRDSHEQDDTTFLEASPKRRRGASTSTSTGQHPSSPCLQSSPSSSSITMRSRLDHLTVKDSPSGSSLEGGGGGGGGSTSSVSGRRRCPLPSAVSTSAALAVGDDEDKGKDTDPGKTPISKNTTSARAAAAAAGASSGDRHHHHPQEKAFSFDEEDGPSSPLRQGVRVRGRPSASPLTRKPGASTSANKDKDKDGSPASASGSNAASAFRTRSSGRDGGGSCVKNAVNAASLSSVSAVAVAAAICSDPAKTPYDRPLGSFEMMNMAASSDDGDDDGGGPSALRLLDSFPGLSKDEVDQDEEDEGDDDEQEHAALSRHLREQSFTPLPTHPHHPGITSGAGRGSSSSNSNNGSTDNGHKDRRTVTAPSHGGGAMSPDLLHPALSNIDAQLSWGFGDIAEWGEENENGVKSDSNGDGNGTTQTADLRGDNKNDGKNNTTSSSRAIKMSDSKDSQDSRGSPPMLGETFSPTTSFWKDGNSNTNDPAAVGAASHQHKQRHRTPVGKSNRSGGIDSVLRLSTLGSPNSNDGDDVTINCDNSSSNKDASKMLGGKMTPLPFFLENTVNSNEEERENMMGGMIMPPIGSPPRSTASHRSGNKNQNAMSSPPRRISSRSGRDSTYHQSPHPHLQPNPGYVKSEMMMPPPPSPGMAPVSMSSDRRGDESSCRGRYTQGQGQEGTSSGQRDGPPPAEYHQSPRNLFLPPPLSPNRSSSSLAPPPPPPPPPMPRGGDRVRNLRGRIAPPPAVPSSSLSPSPAVSSSLRVPPAAPQHSMPPHQHQRQQQARHHRNPLTSPVVGVGGGGNGRGGGGSGSGPGIGNNAAGQPGHRHGPGGPGGPGHGPMGWHPHQHHRGGPPPPPPPHYRNHNRPPPPPPGVGGPHHIPPSPHHPRAHGGMPPPPPPPHYHGGRGGPPPHLPSMPHHHRHAHGHNHGGALPPPPRGGVGMVGLGPRGQSSPSKRKCVPLKQPIPSKFQGDTDKFKGAQVPEFTSLVNFPMHMSQKASPNLPEGMRCCVMCGTACPCSQGGKKTKGASGAAAGTTAAMPPSAANANVTDGKKSDCLSGAGNGSNSSGNSNSNPNVTSNPYAVIPTQNKGLCTLCDVNVWVVAQSGLEIKWCKGCKNFRPWAAFGDKGLATKCVRCRERQREKYAAQKEEKERKKAARNNRNHASPGAGASNSTSRGPEGMGHHTHGIMRAAAAM